jgi:hypothetical protein
MPVSSLPVRCPAASRSACLVPVLSVPFLSVPFLSYLYSACPVRLLVLFVCCSFGSPCDPEVRALAVWETCY